MNFCLNVCIYMDNSLVVLWCCFLVKNAKTTIFEDTGKWFLSKIVYQIKMQAATYWSSHPKNHQTFDFFLQKTDF